MKALLVIAALAASAMPPADKAVADKQPDAQTAPAPDQKAISQRLHWDSNRQQVDPVRTSPVKTGAGPEIR